MDIDEEVTETTALDELREAQWIAEQAELLAREEGFDSRAA
jgi:hypothetical protein